MTPDKIRKIYDDLYQCVNKPTVCYSATPDVRWVALEDEVYLSFASLRVSEALGSLRQVEGSQSWVSKQSC